VLGPTLSSWYTTWAPSHGPPGPTKFVIAGISECSHSSFNGKQGTELVPGLEPVTLQSTKYGTPLGCLMAFPANVIFFVTGPLVEKHTWRSGTLHFAQRCTRLRIRPLHSQRSCQNSSLRYSVPRPFRCVTYDVLSRIPAAGPTLHMPWHYYAGLMRGTIFRHCVSKVFFREAVPTGWEHAAKTQLAFPGSGRSTQV
jgi:hypothetical protein